MDPESKKLLEKMLSVAEENNEMLHKMRRSQKISTVLRVLYWLVLIGITIGAFYFLDPFLGQVEKLSGINIDQLKNI